MVLFSFSQILCRAAGLGGARLLFFKVCGGLLGRASFFSLFLKFVEGCWAGLPYFILFFQSLWRVAGLFFYVVHCCATQ